MREHKTTTPTHRSPHTKQRSVAFGHNQHLWWMGYADSPNSNKNTNCLKTIELSILSFSNVLNIRDAYEHTRFSCIHGRRCQTQQPLVIMATGIHGRSLL